MPRTLDEWLAWQQTLHPNPIDLGLDRVARVLERLQWRRPNCPVVTIGGTNGKGSCVALLDAILAADGLRVGTFTSPHLIHYRERIRIAGDEVSDAVLIAAFERIESVRAETSLTFFEFNTLAALLAFEATELDAMVLEVGLGGRVDAVNIVDADAALVSSVALDHCEWLGPDLESIGREKAGIFRAGRPAIFGARTMPVSIAKEAERLGAQLLRLGSEFDFAVRDGAWDFWSAHDRWEGLPRPGLFGAVQFQNAAAVLQVIAALGDRWSVSRRAIDDGLARVQLAGRFQIEEWAGRRLIFDVAHNPAAAQTLAANLRAQGGSQSTLAVCGMFADKDVEGVIDAMRDVVDAWVVAEVTGPRALSAEQFRAKLRARGANVLAVCDTVGEACAKAMSLSRAGDRISIFGSFHTVGPALEWFENARSVPA